MIIWAIKQDQGLNYMDSGIWEYISFHSTKELAEKDNRIVEVEVQEN